LDDFTGKFCCQGFFPLIRTVKSVLENEPKFMPPMGICPTCPTQEYKTLKKKTRSVPAVRKRRSADEICKEKGEGVWGGMLKYKSYKNYINILILIIKFNQNLRSK
jgi:hypothetical protein